MPHTQTLLSSAVPCANEQRSPKRHVPPVVKWEQSWVFLLTLPCTLCALGTACGGACCCVCSCGGCWPLSDGACCPWGHAAPGSTLLCMPPWVGLGLGLGLGIGLGLGLGLGLELVLHEGLEALDRVQTKVRVRRDVPLVLLVAAVGVVGLGHLPAAALAPEGRAAPLGA